MRKWLSDGARATALRGVGWLAVGFAGAYWGVTFGARAATRAAGAAPLTFSGRLTRDSVPVGGPVDLTFHFKRLVARGGALACDTTTLVAPEPDGTFQAKVDISSCPTSLFADSSATVGVDVDGEQVAPPQPISPVPYAKYAEQAGVPECPSGYVRDGGVTTFVLCRRGVDEVVRVGTGGAVFWVDRYEASFWSNADGTGTQYGLAEGDHPLPFNGQTAVPILDYALSRPGVYPSVWTTWFQAQTLCRLSGKRLPTGEEWLAAALGTPDTPGNESGCGKNGVGHKTALGGLCRSYWGAEDMVGNVGEWTAEWTMVSSIGTPLTFDSWPAGFGGDTILNLRAPDGANRLPGAVIRGGSTWEPNDGAGVFALNLTADPAFKGTLTGARCVIDR